MIKLYVIVARSVLTEDCDTVQKVCERISFFRAIKDTSFVGVLDEKEEVVYQWDLYHGKLVNRLDKIDG